MAYDWRDRLVATKSAIETSESASDNTHFITYQNYDNVDRVLAELVYDGDTVALADSNSDGVPDQPALHC